MKAPPLRIWLIALVAMTACPLAAVFAWLTHSVERKAEREAQSDARDLAARVAARADALPVEAERLLWVLGRRQLVKAEVRSGGARSQTCDPLINDFAALYAYYANSLVVDRGGTVLCSALPFQPGWSVKERAWFRELVDEKRLVIGDAVMGAASGRFVVPLHDRPAVIEHGRVVGRLFDAIPGRIIDNDDFPGPLTEAFEAAQLASV